jgi:hypothetical protein
MKTTSKTRSKSKKKKPRKTGANSGLVRVPRKEIIRGALNHGAEEDGRLGRWEMIEEQNDYQTPILDRADQAEASQELDGKLSWWLNTPKVF